jgi:hypothetical protein
LRHPITAEFDQARSIAAVAFDVVAVIALLVTFGEAVTALVEAGGVAAVLIVEVTVIALFTGLEDAVATDFDEAGGVAAVTVSRAAVIALFANRSLHYTIATGLYNAGFVTPIATDRVPIIAGLSAIDLAIAALDEAELVALVIVDAVAVVALFKDLCFAVAADLNDAVGVASVFVGDVAVIALLTGAGLDVTVAAGGELAGVGAGIAVIGVAVVALFSEMEGAVAADAFELAGGVATVAVGGVAVVAFFAGGLVEE